MLFRSHDLLSGPLWPLSVLLVNKLFYFCDKTSHCKNMHIVAGPIPYRYKRQKDDDGTVRLEERIAQNRTDQ